MFIPTTRQREALAKFKSPAKHILLVGGSRSGKTSIDVESLLYRAFNYPKSRHLVVRYRFNHAKSSVWHETLLPAIKEHGIKPKINNSDYYITFSNGSEIWLGGLDDKDRTEKILGHEYATIYLNEISEISYSSVLIVRTRLAQNIPGLINKMYYDCNPPSPLHWAHREFIEKRDPISGEPLPRPELFDYLLMNPRDNEEHLPPGYIDDFLETLPDAARRRFLLGEWLKKEGSIYDKFESSMIIRQSAVPGSDDWAAGIDFGLNIAGVIVCFIGDVIYVYDDHGAYNMTTSSFNSEITRKWGSKNYAAYCDPSGGERIQEIAGGTAGNNSVDPGIDFINMKMERGEFFICDNCTGVLSEIWDYARDEKERIIKINDHYMDAMRYVCFSRAFVGSMAKQETKSRPVTSGLRGKQF